MELDLQGVRVSCTPEELAQLIALNIVPNPSAAAGSATFSPRHEAAAAPRSGDDGDTVGATRPNHSNIDRAELLRSTSRNMANVLLAFLHHGGRISQGELTGLTRLSGPSLRRPIGALNKRVRAASSGKLDKFCSVTEPNKDNGLQDRIYTADPEVLASVEHEEARIASIANGVT
jgi:hypothetical protein